ncbi:MAG: hypothetical protein Kow0058_10340 [Roseovarius sp.]
MPFDTTRRTMLALAAAALLPVPAVLAQSDEAPDPTDLVPRRFSAEKFARLSDEELYMVHLATRRGRQIVIDGHPPSESRRIIETAWLNRSKARKGAPQ